MTRDRRTFLKTTALAGAAAASGLTAAPPAAAQTAARRTDELTRLLRDTAWQGSVTARGQTGSIRIVFLSRLSVDGALLYFHRLMGDIPAVIKDVDKACKFTPRALKLEDSSASNSPVGTLSVFPCADSETEERELEKKIDRPARKVPNVLISISPDENVLEIIALIAGVEVTYKLTRQAIPIGASLRSWLDGP